MENKTNPGKTKQQEAKLNIYGTLATQRKQPVIKKHKNLTIYNHEEVSKAATAYFKGDSLAGNVWMNKYALKDSDGNLYEKDPDQMHHRIAAEIARIENKYPNPLKEETIYEVLKGFKHIVPQGSPMAGIGNDFQISSLSNCFVIGNPEGSSDSYGGIMKLIRSRCSS